MKRLRLDVVASPKASGLPGAIPRWSAAYSWRDNPVRWLAPLVATAAHERRPALSYVAYLGLDSWPRLNRRLALHTEDNFEQLGCRQDPGFASRCGNNLQPD